MFLKPLQTGWKNILPFLALFSLNSLPYLYKLNYIYMSSSNATLTNLIIKTIISSFVATTITILIVKNMKRFHFLIIVCFSFLWLIHMFVFITFGDYDISIIASAMDSTSEEFQGYIKNIHIPYQLYLVIPYSYLLSKYKYVGNITLKINIYFIILIALSFSPYIIKDYYKFKLYSDRNGEYHVKKLIIQILSKVNTFDLLFSIIEVYELKKIENKKISSDWTEIETTKEALKFNYIIIVGESSPKKAFSYYQNILPSNSLGWNIISDAISPATNTRESIPRLLSKNSFGVINNNLNIIDLANDSGLNTYWFSNQGFIGEYDTPITNLAKRSQHVIFHNKGGFSTAGSDDRLLVDLTNVVKDENTGKLIFLHTMGSHPSFCSRSKFFKTHIESFDPNNEKSCFIDNIFNIEIFIDKVNVIMRKTLNNYKIIFLSDHGLTDVNYAPYKVHGVGKLFSKSAVDIPLIFIDSTKKNQGIFNNKTYYMRDFVHTFADWVGITAKEIDNSLSIYNTNIIQEPYVYQGSSLKKL